MKSYNYQPAGTITVSTTGNIDDLDFQGCAVILMSNATLATIRGLKAGHPGQLVTILSIGAGEVDLSHQSTGSAAANRMINWITGASTPLAPGAGQATYAYDDGESRWKLVGHDQGAWISVPYNAGDFTATAGTWTVDAGDVNTFAYYVQGKSVTVNLFISTTSVSANPTGLLVALPHGFTAANATRQISAMINNGTGTTGFLDFGSGSMTVIRACRDTAGTAWDIATNATYVLGGITFEPV